MSPEIVTALEDNRLLVLEMTNCEGNLAAAKERNSFVIERSDQLWLPYIAPDGMLDGMIRVAGVKAKMVE